MSARFAIRPTCVELLADQTGRQPPEFVIGFAITPEQAQEEFKKWLTKNSWYRPGDLAVASVADKLKGIYLPFWSFSMLAQSQWQAQIGEYWYRTETYTTTDSKGNTTTHTRQVQRDRVVAAAPAGITAITAATSSAAARGCRKASRCGFSRFNLPALKRYEPYFLAGWLAEEYSIARDEALAICQQEFQRQEQAQHRPRSCRATRTAAWRSQTAVQPDQLRPVPAADLHPQLPL